jgi:lipopolysaccharide transport system ATP-binding protein
VVGIIGRNGAGKSTLLKILSKITEPTEGRVELRGRVGSLLEIGTGFHPELTGHENIYLYGAILGMDRWEVTRKFDEIVAFAELEKFVETPVKRYSSGMYMRLAFAVAAHLETEILLVDEVLAVGDIAFQKKCIGKMGDVSKEGRSVLFVSHNMGAIRQLCKEAILLDSGAIQSKGETSEIVADYEKYAIADIDSIWINTEEEDKKQIAFIEKIEVQNNTFQNKSVFSSSEDIYIVFTVIVREENPALKLGFDLIRRAEVVFRSQQVDSHKRIGSLPVGINKLVCQIPANLLNCGEYYIYPLFSIHMIKELYDRTGPAVKFNVSLDTSRSVFHMVLNEKNHPGPVFPLLNWELK